MSKMDQFQKLSLIKDTVATALTLILVLFGIWQYFDGRQETLIRDREIAAIRYIQQWSEKEIFDRRAELSRLWLRYPEFVSYVKSNSLSARELDLFIVNQVFAGDGSAEFRESLFRVSEFFEEMSYCSESQICDESILKDFFCPVLSDHTQVYGRFRQLQLEEIGAQVSDPMQKLFLDDCS